MDHPPNTALADHIRFAASQQIAALWRRRQHEGWTQRRLATNAGRDTGWVSRNLRDPARWSLNTMAVFIHALDGAVDLTIFAVEDAPYDAAGPGRMLLLDEARRRTQ